MQTTFRPSASLRSVAELARLMLPARTVCPPPPSWDAGARPPRRQRRYCPSAGTTETSTSAPTRSGSSARCACGLHYSAIQRATRVPGAPKAAAGSARGPASALPIVLDVPVLRQLRRAELERLAGPVSERGSSGSGIGLGLLTLTERIREELVAVARLDVLVPGWSRNEDLLTSSEWRSVAANYAGGASVMPKVDLCGFFSCRAVSTMGRKEH
jgi:hypothetical protein